MKTIVKYFQYLYQWFKKYKKKWLVFILFSGLFFFIRLPYEETVLYLISQLKEKTKSSIQLKYKSFYINPLRFSLVFNKPEISTTATQNTLRAAQLSLRPLYSSLLRLKAGGIITLKWPGSHLFITVRKEQIEKTKAGWFIRVKARNFNPVFLRTFAPMLSKIKGKINLDMEMLLDPDFGIPPKGYWSLNGKKINSQAFSYKLSEVIGSISLPPFQWSRINFEGRTQNGELFISDISLGEKKDAFQLKGRGFIRIDFIRQNFSGQRVKPRLRNYSLGLDILTSEDLKSKLYLLDMVLPSIGSETPQGWRYLARIKGNATQLFDPVPVSQLPTLEDLQKATSESAEWGD